MDDYDIETIDIIDSHQSILYIGKVCRQFDLIRFFFGNLRGWTSKKLIIDNFAHRLDCLIDFLLFHCRNHQEKKRNCSIWITLLENKAKNEWMNVWLLTQKNNTMNIIIIAVVVVVVIRSRYMSSMMFDRWPNQSIE